MTVAKLRTIHCQDVPTLRIPQGLLTGTWRKSLEDREYASFEGIPYAHPPVGKYRFEESIPAKAWRGVWQAKLYPNICLQWFHIPNDEDNSVVGDEDCLYVNVYTPNLKPDNLLPVLTYIHGGSFLFGAGSQYGPRFIMDHDLVYVSIHYRLGPLGFLSTQDKIVPGNNGLKDQNLALKWIQTNIKHFGGNSENNTIMGMSAGGASVHYHMLSIKSKGLFHRAISQSGTSLCSWTQQTRPREKAFQLGNFLGCPTDDSSSLITCLKLRPAAAIVRTTQKEFMIFDHTPFAPFNPVLEPEHYSDAFLNQHPYKLVNEGQINDVPWINSIVTEEGLYPSGVYLQDPNYLKIMNFKWQEWVPHIYNFNDTLHESLHEDVAEKIKQHYLEGKDLSLDTISGFIDSLSHRHFVGCMEKTIRLHTKSNSRSHPTYSYLFGFSGQTSLGKTLSKSDKNYGVSHGDDTGYVFDTTYMDPTTDDRDVEMVKFMTKMIASFVIDGVPDVGPVQWDPVNIEDDMINYLKINGPDDVVMEKAKSMGDTEFWDSLSIMENENLFDTHEEHEL